MATKKTVWSRKKQRDNRTLKIGIGIFLGLLMVMSVFGIVASFTSPQVTPTSFTDGGLVFDTVNENGVTIYRTQRGGIDYDFFVVPSQFALYRSPEVEQLLATTTALQLTFVPAQNLSQAIDAVRAAVVLDGAQDGALITGGVAVNGSNYALPLVTCADATAAAPVLQLQEGSETGVTLADNCITAQASSAQDLFMLGEYVRYARLGLLE